MRDAMGKILNAVTTILVVIVVAFTLALVGARPFGIYPYTVLSGSMEPEYPTGSLIYVQKTDPDELNVGDVITFMAGRDATVTHRIVEIVPDENDPSVVRYVTKGDANEFEDSQLVHQENVIGKPVLCVPYLGYAVDKVLTPPGSYLAVSFVAIIVFLMFLPDLFTSKEDEDDEMEVRRRTEKDDSEPIRGAHAKSVENKRPYRQTNASSPNSANPDARRRAPQRRASANSSQLVSGRPSAGQGQPRYSVAYVQCDGLAPARGGKNNPRLNKERESQSATQGVASSCEHQERQAIRHEGCGTDGRGFGQVRQSNQRKGF